MIKNYLKIAWRSLWKNKTVSFLNIAGLSIGMTAAVLILLWVQNEMNYDNYHKDASRVYRLTTRLTDNSWIWEASPLLLADAAKREIPEIEKIARLYVGDQPVFNIKGNLVYEKQCAYVDSDWFGLFQYDFIEGNAASFSQSPYSVILTASEAKKYFSNREAIGETIQINGIFYEVKAIVADAPTNSSFQYHAFIPIAALLTDRQQRENDENWENTNYLSFIKLLPGAKVDVTTKRLTQVLQKYSHDDSHRFAISLISLTDMHFESNLQGSVFEHGNFNSVYIFSVLGFLVLLVACINYVNLTTAKASMRAKEVSIRKIVGANRRQLVYQFVIESLLVSLLSLVTALILIKLCLPAFNVLTGKDFMVSLESPGIWEILGLTLLASLLLNSIYPALLLSTFKPLNIFRGITVLKVKDTYLRKGLVVLQFSISVILITSTLVIYGQMHFIQKSNPGYDRSQVLSFWIPPTVDAGGKESIMQRIKQELLTHSSIESVSTANQPIVRIGSATTGVDWEGHDTSFQPKVAQLSADADLQKTLHLHMKEGRWFQQGDEEDKHNFILNETAVQELNIHSPIIGQRFGLHGDKGRIIGVVKDFNYKSMHEKTGSLVVFNNAGWRNLFMVRTAPGSSSLAIKAAEDSWKKMLPGTPLEYNFLDDEFNALYKQDRQTSLLIFVFAVIAIIISALGLFGLAAFAAEQRTKEIGIRKILGATMANIGILLSTDFLKIVGIAIIIASPVAWWTMDRWLQNFAYRISISWWMLGLAGTLALMIALITISYHAIKAGIRSPVKSLRTE